MDEKNKKEEMGSLIPEQKESEVTPQEESQKAPATKESEVESFEERDMGEPEGCKPCSFSYCLKFAVAIVFALAALLFLTEAYMRYTGSSLVGMLSNNSESACQIPAEDGSLNDLEDNQE